MSSAFRITNIVGALIMLVLGVERQKTGKLQSLGQENDCTNVESGRSERV